MPTGPSNGLNLSSHAQKFLEKLHTKIQEKKNEGNHKPGDKVIHPVLGMGRVRQQIGEHPERGAKYQVSYPEFDMVHHHDELKAHVAPEVMPAPIKLAAKPQRPEAPPHPIFDIMERMRPHAPKVAEQQKKEKEAQLEAMKNGADKVEKSLSKSEAKAEPHPHAYDWHDGGYDDEDDYIDDAIEGSKQDSEQSEDEDISDGEGDYLDDKKGEKKEGKEKIEKKAGDEKPKANEAHPHNEAHGPAEKQGYEPNEQVGGVSHKSFKDVMQDYGTVHGAGHPSNLKFYKDIHKYEPKVDKHIAESGYTVDYAGGKHGKPDLKNKNYGNGHLMVYDPEAGSGGDFNNTAYTRTWRKVHEQAHADTYKKVNELYGEGRRMGKLGTHRSPREMKRAVHWEWLAAHRQRDLMAKHGHKMEDHDFHRELNTVLGDAVHRAVTGKFTEPSEFGFEPHSHKVPLEHSLSLIDKHAKKLGLRHDNDTFALQHAEGIQPKEMKKSMEFAKKAFFTTLADTIGTALRKKNIPFSYVEKYDGGVEVHVFKVGGVELLHKVNGLNLKFEMIKSPHATERDCLMGKVIRSEIQRFYFTDPTIRKSLEKAKRKPPTEPAKPINWLTSEQGHDIEGHTSHGNYALLHRHFSDVGDKVTEGWRAYHMPAHKGDNYNMIAGQIDTDGGVDRSIVHPTKDSAIAAAEHHHAIKHYNLSNADRKAINQAWPDQGPRRFIGQHPDMVRAEIDRAKGHFEKAESEKSLDLAKAFFRHLSNKKALGRRRRRKGVWARKKTARFALDTHHLGVPGQHLGGTLVPDQKGK
jgi:hypothetical protein